jgi:hypothetical protein
VQLITREGLVKGGRRFFSSVQNTFNTFLIISALYFTKDGDLRITHVDRQSTLLIITTYKQASKQIDRKKKIKEEKKKYRQS